MYEDWTVQGRETSGGIDQTRLTSLLMIIEYFGGQHPDIAIALSSV